MPLYLIVDDDGNERHVEAGTMAEAIRAWKDDGETEDDPSGINVVCEEAVIRPKRYGKPA